MTDNFGPPSETYAHSFSAISIACRSQVMAGKLGGIPPVGYYPLDTAEYTTAFQAFYSLWLYFSRHGINFELEPGNCKLCKVKEVHKSTRKQQRNTGNPVYAVCSVRVLLPMPVGKRIKVSVLFFYLFFVSQISSASAGMHVLKSTCFEIVKNNSRSSRR